MATPVDAVVFDIGNVLIRWDPRNLYRKLISDEDELERFLAEICTHDWNLEQDRGRSWKDAVAERVALFPEHEELIRAYDERWHEMVPGAIEGSVNLLERLIGRGIPVYAITNFSGEKFREARERFPFLLRFRDIIVSGDVRLLKPDPEIYHLLIDRHELEPGRTLFIDDSPTNISGAEAVGLRTHLFRDPRTLEGEIEALRLL
jgi:2-haloacid dehalogenase